MSMAPKELRHRLKGLLAFPPTVFRPDALSVDIEATADQTDWLVRQGVDGIVAAGATGEFFSLTQEELRLVHRACVDATAGRVPVLVGVGGSSHAAVLLAQAAERCGADGVMVLPHAYGPSDPEGLVQYYASVATSVSLGVVPYSRDAARFEPETLRRLTEYPNIIGFKDAIADLRLWNRLRSAIGDRLVWLAGAGDDLANVYFAVGATGFTSSHVNYDPEAAVLLRDLLQAERFADARVLVEGSIQPLFTMRTRKRGYEVSVTKAAMDLRGRPGGPVRHPFVEVSPSERREIEEALGASAATVATVRADWMARPSGSTSADPSVATAGG